MHPTLLTSGPMTLLSTHCPTETSGKPTTSRGFSSAWAMRSIGERLPMPGTGSGGCTSSALSLLHPRCLWTHRSLDPSRPEGHLQLISNTIFMDFHPHPAALMNNFLTSPATAHDKRKIIFIQVSSRTKQHKFHFIQSHTCLLSQRWKLSEIDPSKGSNKSAEIRPMNTRRSRSDSPSLPFLFLSLFL